jgi:Xaa-Pro aminopeptidase
MRENRTALLLFTGSHDPDFYYATRFTVGDPVPLLVLRGKKILFLSDLEIDRGRREAAVDRVVSWSALARRARGRSPRPPAVADVLACFLRARRVRAVRVPDTFPFGLAEELRRRRIHVSAAGGMIFPERLIKSPREIACIAAVQRRNEEALARAVSLLRRSRPRGARLYLDGEPLTSERVRFEIASSLLSAGCDAGTPIIAGGAQACDPHGRGTGPLPARSPIILDLFPRSRQTGYYSDMTRTVIRGGATDAQRRLYAAVLEAQKQGLAAVRAGVRGADVHARVSETFRRLGYRTGRRNGRMAGFFHGTGHGLGLEIHEPPRLAAGGPPLEAGMVVTVEPGLYYADIGGVRIEDTVVVTPRGCDNLVRAPKVFEI